MFPSTLTYSIGAKYPLLELVTLYFIVFQRYCQHIQPKIRTMLCRQLKQKPACVDSKNPARQSLSTENGRLPGLKLPHTRILSVPISWRFRLRLFGQFMPSVCISRRGKAAKGRKSYFEQKNVKSCLHTDYKFCRNTIDNAVAFFKQLCYNIFSRFSRKEGHDASPFSGRDPSENIG